ncbi:hypothetical protein AM629_03775, partial [Photorhabdus heterorhabditis]
EYWNYKRRDSSFLPMEASVNPSHRRLRPRKWEASPDRAGSSHQIENDFSKRIQKPDNLRYDWLLFIILWYLYPIDFKMDRDGQGANPREHS